MWDPIFTWEEYSKKDWKAETMPEEEEQLDLNGIDPNLKMMFELLEKNLSSMDATNSGIGRKLQETIISAAKKLPRERQPYETERVKDEKEYLLQKKKGEELAKKCKIIENHQKNNYESLETAEKRVKVLVQKQRELAD